MIALLLLFITLSNLHSKCDHRWSHGNYDLVIVLHVTKGRVAIGEQQHGSHRCPDWHADQQGDYCQAYHSAFRTLRQTFFHLLTQTDFYIVSEDDKAPKRIVAEGEEGELWIGGIGVAKGYLHRPDLTVEV
jgi:non-ribosomal peptide synthetase component F